MYSFLRIIEYRREWAKAIICLLYTSIHEFYARGITLDEIAEKLNVTPEYLGSQFHKEVGVTFSTYMKEYRIQKAKKLLIGTNLKLYEVAEQVGYATPKYFSKIFKEVTGQFPAEYRKLNK